MEDTLGDFKQYLLRLVAAVLILVLMEDTLGATMIFVQLRI